MVTNVTSFCAGHVVVVVVVIRSLCYTYIDNNIIIIILQVYNLSKVAPT